jgi:hypothetical protein
MHPELLSAVAAEYRRDLTATLPAVRRPRRALPRFHVTWTRTTLAAVAGRRRARSLVIVISATRTR